MTSWSSSTSPSPRPERSRTRRFLLAALVVAIAFGILWTAHSMNTWSFNFANIRRGSNSSIPSGHILPSPPPSPSPTTVDPNDSDNNIELPWKPITTPPLSHENSTNNNTNSTPVTPLEELVKRLLPEPYHAYFQFTIRTDLTANSATNIYDTFRIYNAQGSNKGAVAIEGATVNALGAGLNHYLKYVCKVEMTWSGDRFDQLPSVPPLVPVDAGVDGVVRASFVPWRYYMNVVTFGYSFAFWDWNRWQRELDWMMLNGINMALTAVGQEHVVRKFYEDQGLERKDIDDFLGGPAFMPWQRMGNIQGAWALQENTTFNNDWIDSQWALQGQIMQRMQAFNITPIMPSFQGFVPRKLPEKYPKSTFVTASDWNEMGKYSKVTSLLPTEPLFTTLSQQFIQLQRTMYKDMGIDLDLGTTENFYLLDLYNEMLPSCTDPKCIQGIAGGVMRAFKVADPKAVWVMQGWFLIHDDPWQPPLNKAFFDGIKEVNDGRDAFVIDLYSDVVPVWDHSNGYHGTNWGWSMLNNFGGGQGLYGTLPTLLTEPFKGYQQPAKSMRGMGITMEGIHNNEYLYQLILDIPWQSIEATYPALYPTPPAKPGAYLLKQQGLEGQTHLEETKQDSQSKTFLDNTPSLNMVKNGFMRTIMWYDQTKVVAAWKQLVESTETEKSKERRRRHSVIQDSIEAVIMAANGRSSAISSTSSSMWTSFSDWIKEAFEHTVGRMNSHGRRRDAVERRATPNSTLPSEDELPLNVSSFQYDLVDVTREVLVGVVLPGLHRELVDAYKAKDLDRTRACGELVLDAILDIDRLLSTHTHFMVGLWIYDARVSARVVTDSPTGSGPTSMNRYRDYLEHSARNQITWWGPHGQGVLADYASKHWGGLVKEFHYPRWRIFVDHLVFAVEIGSAFDQTAYLADSLAKETSWVAETTCLGGCYADKSLTTARDPGVTKKYPLEPVEDTVLVAQDMVDRWGQIAMRLAQASKDAKE
ncbi:hypothetical protein BGX33_005077 [Mortierella sp. NVP41]|nr:hypothetical protein BGX33_005077 [Mortierella sp. NVP41]